MVRDDLFKDEEEFNKLLGNSDYYRDLQRKVIRLANPQPGDLILELGTGVGLTAIELAKRCSRCKVMAIDDRADIIDVAKNAKNRHCIKNLEFIVYDMERIADFLIKNNLRPNTVVFLYSFHHIPDPIARKERIARDLYRLIKPGAKVIIGDGVVPISASDKRYKEEVLRQENPRPKMRYLSVFWEDYLNARESGKTHHEAFSIAKANASEHMKVEDLAGKRIANREGEYPVTLEELERIWKNAGFEVLLCEEVNVFGEAILFLVKP